jgi:hypothetical protein
MLVFHAYIKKMHGSRSKIPSKKSHQAALRGGFNSGVKGLICFGFFCRFCVKNFPFKEYMSEI